MSCDSCIILKLNIHQIRSSVVNLETLTYFGQKRLLPVSNIIAFSILKCRTIGCHAGDYLTGST